MLSNKARVQELISVESLTWNHDLIFQIFKEEEAKTIYKLPLSLFGVEDRLVWWLAKKGSFSVKLAYFLELQSQILDWEKS